MRVLPLLVIYSLHHKAIYFSFFNFSYIKLQSQILKVFKISDNFWRGVGKEIKFLVDVSKHLAILVELCKFVKLKLFRLESKLGLKIRLPKITEITTRSGARLDANQDLATTMKAIFLSKAVYVF